MKHLQARLLVLFFSIQLSAQEDKMAQFPQAYFGIYTGTLHIVSERGEQDVAMEFHLQPTDTLGKYTYKLVYGTGDQRSERPYSLLEEDAEKGEYIVDENNGIILDEKRIDNRLYTLFEVGGNLLTTFITFETDHMVFEIVFAQKERKRSSFATEDSTEVISYPITTVQRAVLTKQ